MRSRNLDEYCLVIRATGFSHLLIGVVFLLSLNACRPGRKTTVENKEAIKPVNAGKPELRTGRFLTQKLSENEFPFQYLNAKISAEVLIDGVKNNFNVSLRARKDSLLWLSFSVLGVEGARFLATPDSVKFIDRLKKNYFVSDYDYLSNMLSTDIDFDLLQSMLIGNSVSFYDEEEKLSASRDSLGYVLSTLKKRKLRKVLRTEITQAEFKDLVQRIWLSPDTYKISKIIINDFNCGRVFNAIYSDFQPVDSLLFPFRVDFMIEARKEIQVTLEYQKVSRENPGTFNFSIPSNYEKIR